MRIGLSHRVSFVATVLALACVFTAAYIFAQNKKPKREEFGHSLKRLRWDEKRRAAVERREPKPERRSRQSEDHADMADAVKLDTLYVVLPVTVTDRATSRFVEGLGKDDFIITEDGRAEQVAAVTTGEDATLPRSIILVMDSSGSQTAYLEASIQAARTLVSELAPSDEMAVVTDTIELLADFTSDKSRLISGLESLKARARSLDRKKPRERSLQFSALFAALRELVPNDDHRSVIIFQTDGDEAVTFRDQPDASDYVWNMPRREYGLQDIFAAAERSQTTIYTVVPGERLVGLQAGELYTTGRRLLERSARSRFATEAEYRAYAGSHPLSEAQVRLLTDRFARAQRAAERVAELTGGWAVYLEAPEQAAGIYQRILSDINHRYSIGYYPTNEARDGRARRVSIKVRGRDDYRVHGRTGYIAPLGR